MPLEKWVAIVDDFARSDGPYPGVALHVPCTSPLDCIFGQWRSNTSGDRRKLSYTSQHTRMQYSRSLHNILKIEPRQDSKNEVRQDLSPEHV
jgi:hypothetical protein